MTPQGERRTHNPAGRRDEDIAKDWIVDRLKLFAMMIPIGALIFGWIVSYTQSKMHEHDMDATIAELRTNSQLARQERADLRKLLDVISARMDQMAYYQCQVYTIKPPPAFCQEIKQHVDPGTP